jgi:hypothetical protein
VDTTPTEDAPMPTSQSQPPVTSHHPGNTESQSAYWRAHHDEQPWARTAGSFETFEDAYRAGIEGHAAEGGGRFEDAEVRLRTNYEARPGAQQLGWDQGASLACRAAWDRAEAWQHGDLGPQQTER